MRLFLTMAALLLATSAHANDLAPTGTLRTTFIARNPVQATVDPNTKDATGPAAELARALARHAGVPVTITGVANPAAVIESVKSGAADIGFVAFDPARATDVDFAQTYALAHNTYVVLERSPIRSVADVDRPGIRIGVGARDAGDFFLTRTLKHAELKRNPGGDLDVAVKMLTDLQIEAYAANRQRLTALVERVPGLRLVPDNFYAVEQSVIVPKGNAPRLAIVNRVIDETRASGVIAAAIAQAKLVGVDVAPKK